LIWHESGFNNRAVSRAGARGIAQFMPGTASWRGLADPFDAIEPLRESADYLRELRNQFGNLGLAAAAYNGSSGRVQNWLNGRRSLPSETRAYVRIITGYGSEDWASTEAPDWGAGSPEGIRQLSLASLCEAETSYLACARREATASHKQDNRHPMQHISEDLSVKARDYAHLSPACHRGARCADGVVSCAGLNPLTLPVGSGASPD
jgi:hypothetical protein